MWKNHNHLSLQLLTLGSQSGQCESHVHVTRSPIFSHFSETLDGTALIRAFGQQQIFISENMLRVAKNMRAYYSNFSSNRWLAVRLESFGNLITFCAGSLAVLGRHGISAGVAGLSISYALSITQALNWVVRMAADRETSIVSVERVREYLRLDLEPAHHLETYTEKMGNIRLRWLKCRFCIFFLVKCWSASFGEVDFFLSFFQRSVSNDKNILGMDVARIRILLQAHGHSMGALNFRMSSCATDPSCQLFWTVSACRSRPKKRCMARPSFLLGFGVIFRWRFGFLLNRGNWHLCGSTTRVNCR